jgi:hypothetical protein
VAVYGSSAKELTRSLGEGDISRSRGDVGAMSADDSAVKVETPEGGAAVVYGSRNR